MCHDVHFFDGKESSLESCCLDKLITYFLHVSVSVVKSKLVSAFFACNINPSNSVNRWPVLHPFFFTNAVGSSKIESFTWLMEAGDWYTLFRSHQNHIFISLIIDIILLFQKLTFSFLNAEVIELTHARLQIVSLPRAPLLGKSLSDRYLYDIPAMNWNRLLPTFIRVLHALRHFREFNESGIHCTREYVDFSLNFLLSWILRKGFNLYKLLRTSSLRDLKLCIWPSNSAPG